MGQHQVHTQNIKLLKRQLAQIKRREQKLQNNLKGIQIKKQALEQQMELKVQLLPNSRDLSVV